MTPEEFEEKIDDLFKSTVNDLKRQAMKAAHCAAVDLESEPDDYIFPRQVLIAILEDQAAKVGLPAYDTNKFGVIDRKTRRKINNIKLYI